MVSENERLELTHNFFIPPDAQLTLARKRNRERHWGFTDVDFATLSPPAPWSNNQLSAVVLDVALDTVQQTFEEAWHFAAFVQPRHWRWKEIKSDVNRFRLLPGIEHKCGLRWRVIDFSANWDKEVIPLNVQDPQTSPYSAVLWAASYFPTWIQAMDGITVPYVWITGYQITIPDCDQWMGIPFLYWNRFIQRVELDAVAVYARCADVMFSAPASIPFE